MTKTINEQYLNRNSSIELLRIVSMLMVVVLHIVGQGLGFQFILDGSYTNGNLLQPVSQLYVDNLGINGDEMHLLGGGKVL